MKLPKKIQEIIEHLDIDLFNFTEWDISYRLSEVFCLHDLNEIKERNITVRSCMNMKDYPLTRWWDISIEDDIFFIKLYKEWLIDLELYNVECDLDTIEWIEFYKFLKKYISKNDSKIHLMDFKWGEWITWKTIIDLKSIISNKNEYEEFIRHIYVNMLPWDTIINEDNYDYVNYNRLTMSWVITDYKVFFKNYCRLLSKNNNLENIINIIKTELECNINFHKSITLKFSSESFYNNTGIYLWLLHLESQWNISILDIYTECDENDRKTYLKIKLNSSLSKVHDILFDWFTLDDSLDQVDIINNNTLYESEYINDKLKICSETIRGVHTSQPWELIKLFYKLKKDWEYSVSYNDMLIYIINHPLEFKKIFSTDFSEWRIREILRKKNKQISEINELKPILKWDFFIPEEKQLKIQK